MTITVVKNIEELNVIIKKHSWFMPESNVIQLELDELNSEVKLKYQNIINKLLNECGCTSGSIIATVSFSVSFTAFLYLYLKVGIEISIWHLVYILLISFLGAVGGKLYGLLRASFRLKKVVKQISNN